MNNVLQNLMRQATQLTQAGRLGEATAAIQSALKGASKSTLSDKANPYEVVADEDLPPKPTPSGIILDGCVFEAKDESKDEFISGTCTHAALTRRYKLYVPAGFDKSADKQRPLVVML